MGNTCCNPGSEADFSYKNKAKTTGRSNPKTIPNISVGLVDTNSEISKQRDTLQKYDESTRTWMHEVNHADNRIGAAQHRGSAAINNE